ncbi:MAG: tetratricopeptide repeat protein, partial [Armatimonadia bacterium]
MSRFPGIMLLAVLAMPLSAQAEGPRPVGLIVDASNVTNPIPFVRFVDVMVETLAASRKWEPTVLTADSPLVRISGAAWPSGTVGLRALEATLRGLLDATRLSDVIVVIPQPSRASAIEVLWLQTGQAGIRQVSLTAPGGGDTAYSALSKQLVAKLDEGFSAAAVAALPPAAAPAPAPVTTPAPVPVTPPAAPTDVPAAPAAAPAPSSEAVAVKPPAAVAAAPAAPPQPVENAPAAPTTLPTPAVTPSTPAPTSSKPETQTTPTAPEAAPPTTPVPPQPAAPSPAQPAVPATPPAAPAAAAEKPVAPESPAQPTALSPYFAAAEKWLAEREFKKVEQALMDAEDAGDPRAKVFYLWAQLEGARQNLASERSWLERTVSADPSIMPAHLRLAELLRGAGLWRKAVDEYQIVLKAEPKNLHAYVGLSALYASQSQPKRAAEILAQAVVHYPNDVSLYLRMGDLHSQRRALPEAEEAYDKAARLSEGVARADALERLGDLYVTADRHHEGFICYAEASKLRAGETSSLTEKRYQQMMATADSALISSLQAANEALRSYLIGKGVVREEAFQAMSDFNSEAEEVVKFADTIVPPAT